MNEKKQLKMSCNFWKWPYFLSDFHKRGIILFLKRLPIISTIKIIEMFITRQVRAKSFYFWMLVLLTISTRTCVRKIFWNVIFYFIFKNHAGIKIVRDIFSENISTGKPLPSFSLRESSGLCSVHARCFLSLPFHETAQRATRAPGHRERANRLITRSKW